MLDVYFQPKGWNRILRKLGPTMKYTDCKYGCAFMGSSLFGGYRCYGAMHFCLLSKASDFRVCFAYSFACLKGLNFRLLPVTRWIPEGRTWAMQVFSQIVQVLFAMQILVEHSRSFCCKHTHYYNLRFMPHLVLLPVWLLIVCRFILFRVH